MDKVCHPQDLVGNGGSDVVAADALRVGPGATHVFAPERIAAAVTFHLLDEKIAGQVCPRSVERVVKRMARAALSVEIPAVRWRALSNRQRLEWLLVSSCTDYRVGARNGIAVLV